MSCCQCQGIEAFFDKKIVKRDLKRYRKKGVQKTTRMLIEAIKAEGIAGLTLLDIGGGIGEIQHELLQAGASETTSVDASTAYIEGLKGEAERQGHADRIRFHQGNFVDLAEHIAAADVVTLDKVICCDHDKPALVSLSAEHSVRLYGFIIPRESWWVKVGFAMANLTLKLKRSPFRVFVHSTQRVNAIVNRNGLMQRFYRKTFLWQVALYGRS